MSTTTIGTAAPGWPSTGAVLDGTRLHVVSRNLDRTRIAIIDITNWDLVAERTIAVGDGAWGLTVAAGGVYLGLYGARGSANLYRLAGSSVQPLAALAVDYIWDLATLPDGRVLGVATEPSLVFTYDPSTQQASDIGLLTARQRPRTCTTTGSRLVVGGTGDGRAFLVDRALSGGAVRPILPSALAGDDTVYCSAVTPAGWIVIGTGGPALDRPAIAVLDPNAPEGAVVVRLPREALVDTVVVVGDDVFATARPSGALYRLDLGSQQLFREAVPVAMSETRDLAAAGPRLIGSSGDGSVWEFRRSTGAVTVHGPEALGLQLRPQRVQSIAAAEDRVEVGGSFTLTRHDLTSGTATTTFLPGEAKGMVVVGDLTYLAVYPIGEIWYWRATEEAPRRLTQLDSDQLRPIALAWSTQLQALLATTTDDRK
ncbi:MAG TPA: hypothetical protein VMM13_10620, partial [Euzebya sp.]|nr:hypothetical protein [Euzebya sp.]